MKVRQFTCNFTGLKIHMIVFTILGFFNYAKAQTTIYSTNFGTVANVNPVGWSFNGVNMNISTNTPSSGYSGASGGAYLGEGNSVAFVNTSGTSEPSSQIGSSEAVLLISSMGYSTVIVSFGMRKSSSGYNSNATYAFEWSADGITYNPISYTEASAGSWGLVSGSGLTLPSAAGNQSNLYLRWSFNRTGTASNFKIDDVVITGSNIVTNTSPTIVMDVVNTSNYLDGGSLVAPISPYITSGVINDPTDPGKTLGFNFTINDSQTSAANLTVTATSNNPLIVPNSNILLTGSSASRNIKINPIAVGYASITINVSDGSLATSYVLHYASSAAAQTPSSTVWHTGMSDASDGIPIDNNYYISGDDELDVLNVYSRSESGLPLVSFDYTLLLGLDLSKPEVDLEAATTSPTTVAKKYWLGSMSTGGSSFTIRLNRDRLFATTISGTGASTTFSLNGYYSNLRTNLVSWGDANGYNFSASSAAGVDSKSVSGFAAEGMVFGPDNTTLYIGLRAPLVPTVNRTKAVIAPILNFESWFNNGSPSGNPTFGAPIELNLGGRGIRDIIRLTNGTYIIVAGNSAGSPITSAIYKWTGNPTDLPVLVPTSADAILNLEGVMEVNTSGLLSMNQLQVISDGGTEDLYNDGSAAKDLVDLNLRKFRLDNLNSLDLCFPITTTISASSNTICAGQTITLNASGANTYTWSEGSNGSTYSVSPTTNTTYSVTGKDIYGCIGTSSKNITVKQLPIITANASKYSICPNENTIITLGGASTYTWSDGSNNSSYSISPIVSTIYSVSGTGINGCSNTVSVSITVNPTPTVTINASQLAVCPNETTTLTVSGASTYTWTNNSNSTSYTVSPTSNTSYSVTGTDGNGCVSDASISIIANPTPTLYINATNTVICSGNTVSLTASGASTYSWTNGPNVASYSVAPIIPTTYSVSGTDVNNCTSTNTISIIVNVTPTISLTATSSTICAGETVTLTANGALTYTMLPLGANSSSEIVMPVSNTTYSLYGSANGCSDSTTVTINVNQLPNISINTTNTLICVGESVTLSSTTSATNYSWSNGATTMSVSVSPTTTTVYSVIVNDGLCSVSSSITQSVGTCTFLNELQDDNVVTVYPNPFNDSFNIKWNSNSVEEIVVYIYNTLGEIIYQTRTNDAETIIDSKDWSKGAYFVILNSKAYKIIKR